MSFFPIIGQAAGNAIRSGALAKNQQEAANAINPVDVEYKTSEFAKEQLDNARNAMNARMPGSQQMEQNVFRNQANSMMNLARVGTPQQMLAAAGAVQGNTNNALNQLAMQEQQYRTGMLGNLNAALGVMTNEGDKVYVDQTNRFNRQYAEKQGLLNSAEQNRANVGSSIAGGVNQIANMALSAFGGGAGGGAGMLGGLFGGGGGLSGVANNAGRATTMGSFNPSNVGQPMPMSPFTMNNLAAYNPQITPYRP